MLPLVVYEPALTTQAEELARELQAPFFILESRRKGLEALIEQHSAVLVLDADGLGLQALEKPLPGPVHVDFVKGTLAWRRQHGGGRGEMIAKACGIKKDFIPRVLDATAGLGRDGFVLASLGCAVQLCERSPVIAALLQNGLARAAQAAELSDIMSRISFLPGDSVAVLEQRLAANDIPDVVCLDPMFPHRQKAAQVKKDMKVFRSVVGEDLDADKLLQPALALARKRVVVKRPRHAPFLADLKPDLQLEGESSRFDIYLKHT